MNFGSSFDLGRLNGANGFSIDGVDRNDGLGLSVSSAGDFNGDGITDLIVGAPFSKGIDNSFFFGGGESYVIFGGRGVGRGGSFDPSTLNGRNGFALFAVNDADTGAGNVGISVSGIGDVNRDGFDDVIVGSGSDKAFVLFGGRRSNFFNGELRVDQINRNDGVTVNNPARLNGRFGSAVSDAGDVNGDGIDDFIVGAPNNNLFRGQAFVVFGDRNINRNAQLDLSGIANGNGGFVLNGINQLSGGADSVVSSAGDVNNDGFADVIVGAGRAGQGGESYVVFGGRNAGGNGTVELADLNGNDGFVLRSSDRGSRLGTSVSGIGDVNNDGIDDFVVGAPQLLFRTPNNGGGRSFVVFGSRSLGRSGVLETSRINGNNGFVINGTSLNSVGQLGVSVSGAGDVNNDGVADLIVGGITTAGGFVIYGGDEVGNGGEIDVTDINGENGFRFFEANEQPGLSVSDLGDFNNDGINDFVVADPNASSTGRTYVVYGRGNTDPEAEDDSFTGEAGKTTRGNVLRNDTDADGDDLTATLLNDARSGALVLRGNGAFSYRPNAGFSGRDSFTYEVSDGNGGTDEATVTFDVDSGGGNNSDPRARNDRDRVEAGKSTTTSVLSNDRDPDGDSLSITNVSRPDNGRAIRRNNGTIVYRPDRGFSGRDSFTYTISDGNGGTDEATVTLQVLPEARANRAPRAQNDRVRVASGQATVVSVLSNDRDPDGDELSLRSVSRPRNGRAIRRNNGTVLYRPDRGFSGRDSFDYTISDGDKTANAKVFVTVTGNNRSQSIIESITADVSDSLSSNTGSRQTLVDDDLLLGGLSDAIAGTNTDDAIDKVSDFLLSEGDRLKALLPDLSSKLADSDFVESLKLGATDIQQQLVKRLDSLGPAAISALESIDSDTFSRLSSFVNEL